MQLSALGGFQPSLYPNVDNNGKRVIQVYYIISKLDETLVLDTKKDKVVIEKFFAGKASQQWELHEFYNAKTQEVRHAFINVAAKSCMHIHQDFFGNKSVVLKHSKGNDDDFVWRSLPNEEIIECLILQKSKKRCLLDIKGEKKVPGTDVIVWDDNGGKPNQRFALMPVNPPQQQPKPQPQQQPAPQAQQPQVSHQSQQQQPQPQSQSNYVPPQLMQQQDPAQQQQINNNNAHKHHPQHHPAVFQRNAHLNIGIDSQHQSAQASDHMQQQNTMNIARPVIVSYEFDTSFEKKVLETVFQDEMLEQKRLEAAKKRKLPPVPKKLLAEAAAANPAVAQQPQVQQQAQVQQPQYQQQAQSQYQQQPQPQVVYQQQYAPQQAQVQQPNAAYDPLRASMVISSQMGTVNNNSFYGNNNNMYDSNNSYYQPQQQQPQAQQPQVQQQQWNTQNPYGYQQGRPY